MILNHNKVTAYLLFLYVSLRLLFPNQLSIFSYGSVNEVLIGIPLYLIVLSYMASGFKAFDNIYYSVKKSKLYTVTLLFICFSLITGLPHILNIESFFTLNNENTLNVNRQMYIAYINYLIFAVVLIRVCSLRFNIFITYKIIGICGVIISLQIILNYYGYFMITDTQLEGYFNMETRGTTISSSANGTANSLLITIIFLFFVYFNSVKFRDKSIYSILLLICVFSLFLTKSRLCWLAFIFFIILSTILLLIFTKRRLNALLITGALFCFLSIILIYSDFFNDIATIGRWDRDKYYIGNSGNLRLLRWELVIPAIYDKYIIGYGLGSSKSILGLYATGVFSNVYSSMHNLYLTILVDTGLVGLILFLFSVIIAIRNFIKLIILSDFDEKVSYIILFSGFLSILFVRMGESYIDLDIAIILFTLTSQIQITNLIRRQNTF